MFETIRELIKGKLGDLDFDLAPSALEKRGHFSTNAAFILAENKKKNPLEVAEELKRYLEKAGPAFAKATAGKGNFFSKIEVAEPGFINFWVEPEVIQEEFLKIAKAEESWGKPIRQAQGKVIVEYSQPNIAKPLQAHHLRSTIIGDAIANILRFSGYEVIRWNYLGDWGTHFGRLIATIKQNIPREEWTRVVRDIRGSAATYAGYPVDEALSREEFKKLEAGDPENRKLWEASRDASIENLKELYKILGIDFEEWTGESFYEDKLPKLTQELQEGGIAQESEGALIIPFEKYNLPPALIRKSDGATLYLTRDIASLEHRLAKYKPDLILYVVDNGQSLHFQQLFAIAKILGLKGNFIHVKFGLLLGKDLKKLSTRAGTGIELLNLVNEAVRRARKIIEEKQPEMSDREKDEVAKAVGIGALKYNDLSQNRLGDITFDWQKMLNLEGNSAPYLQYSYARLKSILRKSGQTPRLEVSALYNEADLAIVLKLAQFPEVIKEVAKTYFPHYLAGYLYELARLINTFYEKEPVLKAEPRLRGARVHLAGTTALTLKTGLSLLGVEVLERL